MKAATQQWSVELGWEHPADNLTDAQVVLYFGSRAAVSQSRCFQDLRAAFPSARLIGCSTGGQILKDDVSDDKVVVLAMQFEKTTFAVVSRDVGAATSADIGHDVGARLARPDLKAVFVLSDGLLVNGSELVSGILAATGSDVTLTGGLAGDGAEFGVTLVGVDEVPVSGKVVALGLYGDAVRIGHGSAGGWDEFGPQRAITRSSGNVLYELDGEPALDLYKRYLGPEAAGLPGTALLYPLLVRNPVNPEHSIVRTILSVDHVTRSLTFAGDVPEGWTAQLMRGYFDRLADAAGDAAGQAVAQMPETVSDTAAILVSCIGRRILMGQSIIDEVAAAEARLGPHVHTAGFYSYGEIAPHAVSRKCELHNQTMTITTIAEAA